jgi:hypothetical protein
LLGTFSANLRTLPDAVGGPQTMAWWKTQPDASKGCGTDLEDPAVTMTQYLDRVKLLTGKPVFLGYPVALDFMFVYWHLIRFTGSTKRNMPLRLFDNLPHDHRGVDDGINQGALLGNMLRELQNSP